MAKKYLVFICAPILALVVFNFEISGYKIFSAGPAYKSAVFIPKAEAKKKNKKAKKLSQKSNNLDFQNPIAISGDDICQKNSKEALKILFDKDRENFDFVASRLGKIECAISGSGVYPWENTTRFKVGVAVSNSGPVWYAGVLVHESCHIEQFKIKEEYSGERAEKQCLDVQIGSLKKLGASQSKIDYVANISQSRYWLLDINKRWW